MALLRKFLARSWADRVLLVRAFVLVSAVRIGLWVLPYRTVHRLADCPVAPRAMTPDEERRSLRRIIGAVEAMSRRLLGTKPCLTQALAAQRILRQEGMDSTLRIGVAKDGQELLAHAWLERGTRVLIGGGHSPRLYAPLVPMRPETPAHQEPA
ncbi:MAG: lasso peptide biosynthesis B2 protein [Rhodothermales bacterium]